MTSPAITLPIRFTNGIDTKSDELVRQKLARLENAVFTRTGALRKRPGYARTAGPSGGGVVRSFKVNDELAVTGFNGVHSRTLAPSTGWTPSKGRLDLGAISEKVLNGASGTARNGDIVALGNVVAVCWYAGADLVLCVYDAITGAQYVQGVLTVAGTPSWGLARFVLEGTNAKLWAVDFQGTRQSYSWTINMSSPPTTLPTAVAAWSSLPLYVNADIARDTVTTFAMVGGAGVYFVNTNGYDTTAQKITIANTQSVAIAIDSSGNRHIAYTTWDGANSVVYLVRYNSTLTTQAYAPVTVETLTGKRVCNVGLSFGAGALYITYDVVTVTGAASDACDLRGGYRSATDGSGSVASIAKFCCMASKIYYDGGFKLWAVYSDVSQLVGGNSPPPSASTLLYLELDVGTARVIARAHQEAAFAHTGSAGRSTEPSSVVTRSDGGSFYIMIARPKQSGVIPPANSVTHTETVVSYDVLATKHDAVQLGQSLQIEGVYLHTYDGARVIEHGFHTPPRISNVSNPTTGGSLSNGSYLITALYAYTDAAGEIHYSRPADVITNVLAGGTATQRMTFQVRVPPLTLKAATGINVIAFVSELNGQILYGSSGPLASTADANGYVSFNVTGVAGISALPSIYTSGGVLRNDPLPPCNFIAKAGDRLWGHVGGGLLWFSKKQTVGRSVEFSAFQTLKLTSFTDPVAMVGMGEYKIVFSPTAIAYFTGDGPNATGSGVFSDDTDLEVDVGCIDYRTIVRTSVGIFFKSSKGYYLLDRGLGLSYIGADVEGYNDQTVVAAEASLTRNQIKIAFNNSTQPVLVYDTYAQQWGTEVLASAPLIVDMAAWRGRFVVLQSNGIHEQQDGLYADNSLPYSMLVRTGWLTPQKLQGLMRVREFAIQGVKRSDHNLVVKVRYDYDETVVETFTFVAGALVTGDYSFRCQPKRQQCKAISLEMYDDFTGFSAGEGWSLAELLFTLATEEGPTRQSAARTVVGV